MFNVSYEYMFMCLLMQLLMLEIFSFHIGIWKERTENLNSYQTLF